MSTMICRPFITLRNGRRLYAHEVGKTAFCFEVDEVKPAKPQGSLEVQLELDDLEDRGETPLH